MQRYTSHSRARRVCLLFLWLLGGTTPAAAQKQNATPRIAVVPQVGADVRLPELALAGWEPAVGLGAGASIVERDGSTAEPSAERRPAWHARVVLARAAASGLHLELRYGQLLRAAPIDPVGRFSASVGYRMALY